MLIWIHSDLFVYLLEFWVWIPSANNALSSVRLLFQKKISEPVYSLKNNTESIKYSDETGKYVTTEVSIS